MPRNRTDYPDDIFDNTRMSFGDHIEELRSRLLKAIYGLLFFLIIGFVLDTIGESLNISWLGIGRPMMNVINDPVESQVRDFYDKRNASKAKPIVDGLQRTPDDELAAIREKREKYGFSSLSKSEVEKLRGEAKDLRIWISADQFEKTFGLKTIDPDMKEIEFKTKIMSPDITYLSDDGTTKLATRKYLTTLSATEAFMVYFKVSLLCGFILGSPWIFYQIWAFIGAGLYPHEKKYVHLYLPFSIILFLVGVVLCQFIVLPGAVKALLAFNNWIDLDPDLRLKEWLGFALILPLVFGLSFQTPLVMFFLSRIHIFTAADYLKRWRGAIFTLAIFAAIITPTPDIVTMLYLFVPMFGLYMFGIAICHFFPAPPRDEEIAEDQIAV